MKKLFITIGTLLATALIGWLLLALVYCIPVNSRISGHVEASTYELKQETICQKIMARTYLDNFSDCTMLSQAEYPNGNPFMEALLCNQTYLKDNYNPKDTLEAKYIKHQDNRDFETITDYKYWHGYLIWLKPLLFFTTYFSIRQILMSIEFIMFIWLIIKLALMNQKYLAASVVVLWLFFNPVSTSLSMQYFTATFVMLLASLVVVYKPKCINSTFRLCIFFMLVGCMSSYFDLLSFPLVTFGIPLTLHVYLSKNKTFKEFFMLLLKTGIFWTLGYFGMWFLKWSLMSVFLGSEVFLHIKAQFAMRAGDGIRNALILNHLGLSNADGLAGRILSFGDTMIELAYSGLNIIVLFIVLFVIVLTVFILCKSRLFKAPLFFQYLIISFIPFVWGFVVLSHTNANMFFTYRILSVSLFALLTYCSNVVVNYKLLKQTKVDK